MVSHRQSEGTAWLLRQQLEAVLLAMFELSQYALLLQSAHYRAAALLAKSSSRADVSAVQREILASMSTEWQLVLKLEKSKGTQDLLACHCPFTAWQPYRETMCMCEAHDFAISAPLLSFLAAYHPPIQNSSNIEDIFSSVEDCVKRSSKAAGASIPNICAVGIRSVQKKIANSEGVQGSELRSEDWEGNSVRGLKASVFQPQTCPASDLASAFRDCFG